MFSTNTALQTWESVTWQKKLTKIGVVCQNAKGVFCHFFWVLVVLFFCFSVFLCFCFVHNSPKWLFSCIFRGFLSILFPQKACLKLFLFFLSCFSCFCLPFQKSIFLYFLSINPFLEKILCFCFSCACLFPFLMFACLFETNFPNILFLKPKLLAFLAVSFFFCCFFVFMVYVSSLYVSMLALFLVFFCFVLCFFCLVSWFAFSLWKSFSLQFWCFFWVMLVKRVVWFLCFMFLFLFVFLVLLVSI